MANQSMQLDHVFGALSDATRRAIVMRLCEGEASVGELAKPFEMALPSLMKHIRVLESSGLVASEKTGRVRMCPLQTEALATIEAWLAAQREIWEQRLDRLEMYVEKLKKQEKSNARKRKSKSNAPVHLGARSRDRLSRVINAPRELVFSAWADPRHLPQWFGPAGFRVETKSMDIRVRRMAVRSDRPDCKRHPNRCNPAHREAATDRVRSWHR